MLQSPAFYVETVKNPVFFHKRMDIFPKKLLEAYLTTMTVYNLTFQKTQYLYMILALMCAMKIFMTWISYYTYAAVASGIWMIFTVIILSFKKRRLLWKLYAICAVRKKPLKLRQYLDAVRFIFRMTTIFSNVPCKKKLLPWNCLTSKEEYYHQTD